MRGHRVYLTGCGIAVMAGIAVVGTAGVMRPGAAGKGRRAVTEIAVQAGRDMRRYRVYLAGRGIAVMAGLAAAGNAGMIEGRRGETTGIMANAAILTGVDMAGIFGRGKSGSMTG